MFFQVNFSPAQKVKKPKEIKLPEEEVAVLSLAPFTATPKLFFENVALGETITKKLLIRNPTKCDMEISLTQIPPEERMVSFSWKQTCIPRESEILLEIQWHAIKEGAWRDTLLLEGQHMIKKNISIVFKSIQTKKSKKQPVKKTSLPRKPTFPAARKISPIKKVKKSPKRPVLQPNIFSIPKIIISPTNRRETYNIIEKENFQPLSNHTRPKNSLLNVKYEQENSFDLSGYKAATSLPVPCLSSTPSIEDRIQNFEKENFDDSLENILTLSSQTYVKNCSFETYVKHNVSGATYIKGNTSSGTYIKDSSIGNIASLELSTVIPESNESSDHISKELLSPILKDSAKNIIEANLWSNSKKIVLENKLPDHFNRKRKSDTTYQASPPKRVNFSSSKLDDICLSKNTSRTKISKVSKNLNLKQFIENSKMKRKAKEESVVLHNPEDFLQIVTNPYILATTNDVDPFMSATLYLEPRWVDQQEFRFKKLLNALLTPPDDLNTVAKHPVDVAKLWQECQKQEVCKVLTNDEISDKHVSSRLNVIRKSAQHLFKSPQISEVLYKCVNTIENGKLSIRKDRDVHLDKLIMQEIISLFLSYNPIWLRIGLETVFGAPILLKSNSDIFGIVSFLSKNYFKDPYLLRKYKTVYHEKYSIDIKKHILKKFLMFVYFLDRAKLEKLIPYDPCLFCKNSPIKESKEIILKFSRDVLSSMGDITKFLRLIGYTVEFKQLYIDEYEYTIDNLGVDLRDGVRLTRIMEIILLENNLMKNLRVPAISRLQKIHNMKIVFDSLQQAGYEILHDISAKDIVDGHKEKTLSFLWQIIYKFQAPRFIKAVSTIQKWWRSFPVMLKRRILNKTYQCKINAVRKIESWYKRMKTITLFKHFKIALQQYLLELKRNRSAIKIQSYYRMYKQRTMYKQIVKSIILIQTYSQKWLFKLNHYKRVSAAIKIQAFIRSFLVRRNFLKLKGAVTLIQEKYRGYKQMKLWADKFQKIKSSALFIQRKYRANKMMKEERGKFMKLKASSIFIQRKVRGKLAMKIEREKYLSIKHSVFIIESYYITYRIRRDYLNLKNSVITIQNQFRANKLMQNQRYEYVALKNACMLLQERFRAHLLMKEEYNRYNTLKQHVISIQQKYRAKISMKKDRNNFINYRNCLVKMQQRFRANKAMKIQRQIYLNDIRKIYWIQQKFKAKLAMKKAKTEFCSLQKAVLTVQRKLRANLAMRKCRDQFVELKENVIRMQNRFRANKLMERQRNEFLNLRKVVITIQRRLRAKKIMEKERDQYRNTKTYVIKVQRLFRAKLLMQKERMNYLNTRQKIISIQRKIRANQAMKKQRGQYLKIRNAAIKIQQRFRAYLQMKEQRKQYTEFRNVVIFIQNKYKAKILMNEQRKNYLSLRNSAKIIQSKFRAKKLMEQKRMEFVELKKAVLCIQSKYRAIKLMQEARNNYLRVLKAVSIIQTCFTAYLEMKKQRTKYLQLKNSTIHIQRRFRANILMKKEAKEYSKLRQSAIFIQSRFRMIRAKKNYQALRKAAITIQRRFRAQQMMKKERAKYLQLKNATTVIQTRYRAKQLMQMETHNYKILRISTITIQSWFRMICAKQQYQKMRNACLTIQRWFRAQKMMQIERKNYCKLKDSAVLIQRRFRSYQLMKKDQTNYNLIRKSIIAIQSNFKRTRAVKNFKEKIKAISTIQTYFRAWLMMKEQRKNYLLQKNCAVIIQRRFRANLLMKKETENYQILRKAVIFIQNRFRANCAMKRQSYKYNLLKQAAIFIQNKYKAKRKAKTQRAEFLKQKEATIFIQRKFRAKKAMIEAKENYDSIKKSALIIQTRFRAYLLMKSQQAHFRCIKNSTIVIQRKLRATLLMRTQLHEYQSKRNATIILQKRFRANCLMKRTRREFLATKEACVLIQRRFRANGLMEEMRMKYLILRKSVILIQKWYRSILLMQRERTIFKEKLKTVLGVQKYGRGYLTRKLCKELMDPVLVEQRRLVKLRQISATRIQALWKGYLTRKDSQNELKKIRRRVEVVNQNAKAEQTLRNRVDEALIIILNNDSSRLIRALSDIEFITRRCKDTCNRLGDVLNSVMYAIILTPGRSAPNLEASTFAASCIINFAKIPETLKNTWNPDSLDGLIKIMGHCCDKEGLLFPYLCTLLYIFGNNKEYKQVICNIPKLNHRLSKMGILIERKQNMIQNNKYKIQQSLFCKYTNLPLPYLKPDWGFDFKSKPRTFTNSVHAIKVIISLFNAS